MSENDHDYHGNDDNDHAAKGWTTALLYRYFTRSIFDLDRRIQVQFQEKDKAVNAALQAAKEAVAAALSAAKEAVTKAETATEKRFEAGNEIKKAMSDAAALFITRTEVDAKILAVDQTLKNLDKAISTIEGRINIHQGQGLGMSSLFSAALAVGAFVVLVIDLFLRH